MRENPPLEHGRRAFFSPAPLFVRLCLRVNPEQQIPTPYNYLLRTWEARGTPRGIRVGARAQGERRFQPRHSPRGGGRGKGRGGAPNRPRGRCRNLPASPRRPFTGTPGARTAARALPPPPPTLRIAKLRPRAVGEGNCETTQPKVTRQASGRRTPRLPGFPGPRHHPRAQGPGLRPRRRARPAGAGGAEVRDLGGGGDPCGAQGAARIHSSRPRPPPRAAPAGKARAEAAPVGGHQQT